MTSYFHDEDATPKAGEVVYPNRHFSWKSMDGRVPEFSGVCLVKSRNSRDWMARIVRTLQDSRALEETGLEGEEKESARRWLGKWFDNTANAKGLRVFIQNIPAGSVANPPVFQKLLEFGVKVYDVTLKLNYGLRITGLLRGGAPPLLRR